MDNPTHFTAVSQPGTASGKLRRWTQEGRGELGAAQARLNRLFVTDREREPGEPSPRHVIHIEDVTRNLGLDETDRERIHRLIQDTQASYGAAPHLRVSRIVAARGNLSAFMVGTKRIAPDVRMELQRRAMAWWKRNGHTTLEDRPMIRHVITKAQIESRTLLKAGGPFIGPRGGRWADAKHTIPWKEGMASYGGDAGAYEMDAYQRAHPRREAEQNALAEKNRIVLHAHGSGITSHGATGEARLNGKTALWSSSRGKVTIFQVPHPRSYDANPTRISGAGADKLAKDVERYLSNLAHEMNWTKRRMGTLHKAGSQDVLRYAHGVGGGGGGGEGTPTAFGPMSKPAPRGGVAAPQKPQTGSQASPQGGAGRALGAAASGGPAPKPSGGKGFGAPKSIQAGSMGHGGVPGKESSGQGGGASKPVYTGPRGGKWADPEHTIAWKPGSGGGGYYEGEGAKHAAPNASEKAAGVEDGADGEGTDIPNFKLRITGKDHAKMAHQLQAGVAKATDLCKISPPVCNGNLGIERKDMPQFSDDLIPKFLKEFQDAGVKVTKGTISVGALRATQKEIDASKSFGMADAYRAGSYDPSKKPIIVSGDDPPYVLDGHHRWAAMVAVDPAAKMRVYRVNAPIKKLLEKSASFAGVEKQGFGEHKPGEAGSPKVEKSLRKALRMRAIAAARRDEILRGIG